MDWRVFSFKAPTPFACGGVVSLIRTCYSFFVCISSVFIPPSRRSSLKCTANMVFPTPTPPSPPQEHIATAWRSRPHHSPSCLAENLQKGVKWCALPYKRYTVLVQKNHGFGGGAPFCRPNFWWRICKIRLPVGFFCKRKWGGWLSVSEVHIISFLSVSFYADSAQPKCRYAESDPNGS